MTEGDEILKEILANPTDMGLRAIYADWLEDNQSGHPARWEMLRGRTVRMTKKLRWVHVWPECRELACSSESNPHPVIIDEQEVRTGYGMPYHFQRGFLARMPYHKKLWERCGPVLVRKHPLELNISIAAFWKASRRIYKNQMPAEAFEMLKEGRRRTDAPGDDLITIVFGGAIREYDDDEVLYKDAHQALIAWAQSVEPGGGK